MCLFGKKMSKKLPSPEKHDVIDPNEVLSKKEKHFNAVDEIISCCLSTAQAPPLVIHKKGGTVKLRGQLHAYIAQPFGTHKSYALQDINPKLTYHMRSFTLPALLGTINKDGEPTESAIVQAAGRTLVIDEAHKLTMSARDSLNELLEKQKDERTLGFKVKAPLTVKGPRGLSKFAKVTYNKNEIRVQAQFSCLAMGLYGKKNNDDERAFLSRFVYIPMRFDDYDLDNLLDGNLKKNIQFQPVESWDEVDDYNEYKKVYLDTVRASPFYKAIIDKDQIGFIQRNINDSLRFRAWFLQKKRPFFTENEVFSAVFCGFLRHVFATSLTPTQLRIIDMLQSNSMKMDQVAKECGVSYEYVRSLAKKYEYLIQPTN